MLNKPISVLMFAILLTRVLVFANNFETDEVDSPELIKHKSSSLGTFEPPAVEWNKTYGGPSIDSPGFPKALVQTSDGGYVMVGITASFGDPDGDFWLVKTDVNGDVQWNKTYGTVGMDAARAVVQTNDGGYAIAGTIWMGTSYYDDFFLVKTNASGTVEWSQVYSEAGMGSETAHSMIETDDGGYAIVGWKYSPSVGNTDIWFVKTDGNGNMEWNKTYGDTGDNSARCVIQTDDGGYALVGFSGRDSWFIKTDGSGNMEWNKTYGGASDDVANCVVQTTNGYVIAGSTRSFGAGQDDVWLIKTDCSGDIQWNTTYGGTENDGAVSVIQTSDGGYGILGTTWSFAIHANDPWLIKTDAEGYKQWDKVFGGESNDGGHSLVQTRDGGYALLCAKSHGYPNIDFWLIKLAAPIYVGDVYIRADGSIDPSEAPISSLDNVTYTVTSNINGSIVVERSNSLLDGDGYTLQGPGEDGLLGVWVYFHVSNVTIQNMNIEGFHGGIWLTDNTDCIVRENNIISNKFGVFIHHSLNGYFCDNNVGNNGHGFYMQSTTLNNTLIRNNIEGNECGATIDSGCSYNCFYHNNFMNNSKVQAWSVWEGYVNYFDNGYPDGGNYWSESNGTDSYSGPCQNETGSDGFADSPYIFEEDNTDNYPLMTPTNISRPHVPIIDPSIEKLPFRLSIEPVDGSVGSKFVPDREYMVILWETIGRHSQLLAKLTPQPEDDVIVKIWYLILADKDEDGQLSWEEIVEALMDAILDELEGRLQILALDYMLELQQSVFLQAAFPSLEGLASGLWKGLKVAWPYAAVAALTYVGVVSPVTPTTLEGFSVFGYGTPWTEVGCGLSPCSKPYVSAACPVDLEIVDDEDRVVNKTHSQIPDSWYLELDLNGDGSLDDLIHFPETTTDYSLMVIPETGANENDTYTLILGSGGFGLVLKEDAKVGNVSENGYTIKNYDKNFLDNLQIHDIAVSDLALQRRILGQGFNLSINVLVENNGNFTETFNMSVYANTTIIDTLANITLTRSNYTTLTFMWNTAGFAKGNYTISAYAWPVQGETCTSDNTFTDGWVIVTIPGDVDGDFDVDIYDVVKITGIYGSKRGDPQFNPNSDLDGDGEIKIYDVVICTSHYRQEW